MGSFRRAIEPLLAAIVLLIAAITLLDLPGPYPHWPTVGPVPVDPELVVPGLLALVVLPGTVRDGITVGSIGIGILVAVTLWAAATSLYTLYSATGGGVFFGGLVTLASGIALAVAVLLRSGVREWGRRGSPSRVGDRFGE